MSITETAIVTAATTPIEVLFVDLDHTLISTDLLAESFVKAVKQSPMELPRAMSALVRGRAAMKAELAKLVTPDVTVLPYNPAVIEFLRQQKEAGVKLVLATASPMTWARAVADHLGLFDDVLASDSDRNLKGRHKRQALCDYAKDAGYLSWGYIGDSAADLPIFQVADQSYMVSYSRSLERRANRAASGHLAVLSRSPFSLRAVIKAMRPHQWVKNLLVFVPMVLAHAFGWQQIAAVVLAWLCFSCVASGVYILNDMLDVESDRHHPKKRNRPFASAKLSLTAGIPLFFGLTAAGMGLAAVTLPVKFTVLLFGYFCLTTLYSVYLKNKLILDVMVLAGLYTLRVIAGGAAVDVPVSEWLMAFSIFLFTSLAFAKRYAELSRVRDKMENDRWISTGSAAQEELLEGDVKRLSAPDSTRLHGRSYRVGDLGLIENLGPTSGYMSVLVLALYINSPQVASLYHNGSILWYVCPLVMYWITRLWFVAKRGKLSEDPIVFALKDGVSLLTGLLVLIVMVTAILV